MRRARVVTFVLPGFFRYPIGGYRVVYEYANQLAQAGYRVHVVLPRFGDVLRGMRPSWRGRFWPLKARAIYHPLIPWFRFHPGVTLHLLTEWREAALPDADAVFATAQETAAVVAALPDAKGRKFYLVQHFETWSASPEQLGATFRLPFTVVAISRWLERIVRDHGATDVAHIPNGLDHAVFRQTGVPRNPRAVATLYHDQPWKGVADAIGALTRLRNEEPSLELTMFGVPERGPDVPDWIGYVRQPSPDRLVAIYNHAAIYVSASIAEGWALPPAEAMSCGALFVGTDSGGCRDFAEPEVTALLSPPGDPEALLDNLRRALAGHADIDAMRQRGTERIRQFTWEASGRMLRTLIEA